MAEYRPALEADVPKTLDQLKDRIEWFIGNVDVENLKYQELAKLEKHSSSLNDVLAAIFERLDLNANF